MTYIIVCIVRTAAVESFEMKKEFHETYYHNKIKKKKSRK